jgi:hypothetical protein
MSRAIAMTTSRIDGYVDGPTGSLTALNQLINIIPILSARVSDVFISAIRKTDRVKVSSPQTLNIVG